MTIGCIDAGHGGSDPGASALGIRECDIALTISEKIRFYLENIGVTIFMTRQKDVDVFGEYASLEAELQARCDISDKANADFLISVHCNAYNTEARGTETFYYANSAKGRQLAQCVQNQIIGLGDLVDRGIKNTPLYMTKHPDAAAILVELAFIDEENDSAKLGDAVWQDNFAKAIARGATDYLGAM